MEHFPLHQTCNGAYPASYSFGMGEGGGFYFPKTKVQAREADH